jgi:hypothetical protein
MALFAASVIDGPAIVSVTVMGRGELVATADDTFTVAE